AAPGERALRPWKAHGGIADLRPLRLARRADRRGLLPVAGRQPRPAEAARRRGAEELDGPAPSRARVLLVRADRRCRCRLADRRVGAARHPCSGPGLRPAPSEPADPRAAAGRAELRPAGRGRAAAPGRGIGRARPRGAAPGADPGTLLADQKRGTKPRRTSGEYYTQLTRKSAERPMARRPLRLAECRIQIDR